MVSCGSHGWSQSCKQIVTFFFLVIIIWKLSLSNIFEFFTEISSLVEWICISFLHQYFVFPSFAIVFSVNGSFFSVFTKWLIEWNISRFLIINYMAYPLYIYGKKRFIFKYLGNALQRCVLDAIEKFPSYFLLE